MDGVHVFRSIPAPYFNAVLPENNVKDMMQRVFNAPVYPGGGQG
jgi:hypothetical protein